MTNAYSFADLNAVVKDAAMGPIRDVKGGQIMQLSKESLRPVSFYDFKEAIGKF